MPSAARRPTAGGPSRFSAPSQPQWPTPASPPRTCAMRTYNRVEGKRVSATTVHIDPPPTSPLPPYIHTSTTLHVPRSICARSSSKRWSTISMSARRRKLASLGRLHTPAPPAPPPRPQSPPSPQLLLPADLSAPAAPAGTGRAAGLAACAYASSSMRWMRAAIQGCCHQGRAGTNTSAIQGAAAGGRESSTGQCWLRGRTVVLPMCM